MFAGWGSWVARFRWPVLSVALVAVISAGVWGLGVFGQLSEGGYNDPNSESAQASEAVQKAFGAQGGDLVVIYTPANGKIDDAALGKQIRTRLAALPKSAATSTTSYWTTKSPQFTAKDRKSAVAVVTLAGADDGAKLAAYREIDDKFAVPGATVSLAGGYVLADATSSRSTDDLARAEIISLPIVLILLLLLFGSLVAASLPVLVGGAAVLGSLGVLHAIANVHEVNSFAVNVASLLGLGMAIDYGLFMVGRFREEQSQGRTPSEAVRRTVATAGRTVVFSATLLMTALAGLLLFPQGFLKSLAYGGLAAVALAALLSLTLLPAMLAILGPRVDKLPIRLPFGGSSGGGSFWERLAAVVLRRPVLVVLPILAGLLVLAAPIAGVRFGEADERTLPASDPARAAIETLKSDYPQFSGNGMPIVLRGKADSAAFAVTLRQIPGIAQLGPAQRAGDVTVFTATLKSTDPFSTDARDVVDQIRSLPVPNGAELLVGGTTARNVDSLAATAAKLPWMALLLVGATLLLMFFAFGSILLPIKAVVMSALSLSATFGILVWIFQDGNGAALLNVTPAPLEAGIVVLMAAVVFGLSTDYEVFLLSRMVEARAHGATTSEAVTVGLARTGRVISAAALLLIVVTGAFALSSVTTMRFVGVGMIVALVLDATVVRMLLVPAVLGLMGNAAWWAPGPLRRLQERAGLAEHAELPEGKYAAAEVTAVLALPPGREASASPDSSSSASSPTSSPSAPSSPSSPASSWDREAAGVLVLPPAMVPPALPPGRDSATEVIPRIVDEPPAPDDEIVDAEIVEDDTPAPAATDGDDHVDAEVIEDKQPTAATDEDPADSAAATATEEPAAEPASAAIVSTSAAAESASSAAGPGSSVSEPAEPAAEPTAAEPGLVSEADESDPASTRVMPAPVIARDETAAVPEAANASAPDEPAADLSDDRASNESASSATPDTRVVAAGPASAVVARGDRNDESVVTTVTEEPVAPASAAAVVEDEPGEAEEDAPVADSDASPKDEPTGFSSTPSLPITGGVYRSTAVSTYPDYSAPDDFFFAPSANGTFADSLGLPAEPERQVPYFGDRPSFEKPSAPDLDVTRAILIPGLTAPKPDPTPAAETVTPTPSADPAFLGPVSSSQAAETVSAPPAAETVSAPPAAETFSSSSAIETPAIFEAPNREAVRSFESPDPEIAQSVSVTKVDPPAPAPTDVASEVGGSIAPELETTRRLRVPGYAAGQSRSADSPTSHSLPSDMKPPAVPAPAAEPQPAETVVEPLSQRRTPTPPVETVPEPLPPRPTPSQPVEKIAEPMPRRSAPPVAGSSPARAVPSALSSPAPGGSRPSDLGALFSARRALEDETPQRPSTRNDHKPFRPPYDIASVPALPPAPATPPAPRRPADLGDHLRESRPADLGDHLRESRPADLAQYSQGRKASDRTRRTTAASPSGNSADEPQRAPTKADPKKPARRPATLADQLPKPRRKPEDEQPPR
ncbi:MMPL family transporter [Actinoplanes solisilvae]|uniref:MMPL family transporter n=1 Tax=Actinoplanes solisilvae TaxID=2486853 RepID=UPI00196AED43|nr:MMPL family transporter [Actinoplanes solisilvae]